MNASKIVVFSSAKIKLPKNDISYWHSYPDTALIRLQDTNSIGKASGDCLATVMKRLLTGYVVYLQPPAQMPWPVISKQIQIYCLPERYLINGVGALYSSKSNKIIFS